MVPLNGYLPKVQHFIKKVPQQRTLKRLRLLKSHINFNHTFEYILAQSIDTGCWPPSLPLKELNKERSFDGQCEEEEWLQDGKPVSEFILTLDYCFKTNKCECMLILQSNLLI